MKSTPSRVLAAGAVLASLLVALPSEATISYTVGNAGLSSVPSLNIDGSALGTQLAGSVSLTQTAVFPGDPAGPYSYVTLCVDILGTVAIGSTYTFNPPADPSFPPYGLQPTWGVGNAGGLVDSVSAQKAFDNAAKLFYWNYGDVTGGSADKKAGLQLAVWSALYNTDNGGVVSGTRFTYGAGGAATEAASYLAGLGALTTPPVQVQLFVPNPTSVGGHTIQEFLYIPSGDPVPEPTTVIAGLLALLPLGLGMSRNWRTKNA